MDVTPYREPRPAPWWALHRAQQHPDAPRFFVPEAGGYRPVRWGAYAASIRTVAAGLRERFEPGQRGAIFAANGVAWAEAALGLVAAGMVMVPIYPASTASQAAYVVEHSEARVLFVAGADLMARVFERWDALSRVETIVVLDDTDPAANVPPEGPGPQELEAKFVHWSQLCAQGRRALASEPDAIDRTVAQLELEAPAIMLYTSGTTGNPKGVPLTHLNLGANTRDWLDANAALLPEGGVDLLWLPMSHIFGYGELCLGNILGFTTYLATAATVLEAMPRVRPSVFMSVPAYWEKLAAPALAADTDDAAHRAFVATTGGRLRYCLSGGAGLKREVKEVFHRCGTLIIEGYGLTETSPSLTMNRPNDFRFDTVGKPLQSVQVRLAANGEILARGPNVFSGYHNDPAATEAAFTADGWFRTGDVGRWTADGFLQIVDRIKEILVTAGGKNVPPANVERGFATEPLIAHAVVYGDGKKYLVAGIWLDEAAVVADLDRRDIAPAERNAAREQIAAEAVDRVNAGLARFEQIKRFAIMQPPLTVEAGQLTATLKLRRRRVHNDFRAVFEDLYLDR